MSLRHKTPPFSSPACGVICIRRLLVALVAAAIRRRRRPTKPRRAVPSPTHLRRPSAPCPTPTNSWELKRLHPGGLATDWLDKLRGQLFVSDSPATTHEHYLQVRMGRVVVVGRGEGEGEGRRVRGKRMSSASLSVLPACFIKPLNSAFWRADENKTKRNTKVVRTTVEPTRRAPGAALDAYEYTARHHHYAAAAAPAAKFTYDLSPMQVRDLDVIWM